MAEARPGPPRTSNHDDRLGQRPTEPLSGPTQPPAEALAGFWWRLVAAFLDWLLVGVAAAAVGELFGVEAPAPSARS
jgi:hypothetical protein